MPEEVLSSATVFGQPQTAIFRVRDRIKALVRVPAGELLNNPKNWRRHPKGQTEALRGFLAEIGYADALLVRELPDGRLMLIDGHLRKETTPKAVVPVLVLDLDESEADKLLMTLDPLGAMAESDADESKNLSRRSKLTTRRWKGCCGARPAIRFGERFIRTRSRPPKSTRRASSSGSGKPNPANSGGLVSIGCSAATQPRVRTLCG
jgi:hypothetical protein